VGLLAVHFERSWLSEPVIPCLFPLTQRYTRLLINSERKTLIVRDKPRVFLSIRHYYPDGGGAEVLAHRLAVHLVRQRLDLTVLTGRFGRTRRREKMDGVPVLRHFIGVYVPVVHEVCYLLSLARELFARRNDYDVIHVFQTNLSACVASLIGKRLGKRIVTTCHNAGEQGDISTLSSLPGGGRLLQLVCQKVDGATGVSKDVVHQMLAVGFSRKRTWYVPNGVPHPLPDRINRASIRSRFGLGKGEICAVFVGRLAVEKALDLLIDAWGEITQRYRRAKLVLVGDGKSRELLEKQARETGVGEAVAFVGKVDDVASYLFAADLFVLPSVTEGMSMALLEAMALGLPVVASRVGGTVDVIADRRNGLLFESGDKEGLIRCITSLIASKKLRTELGRAARKDFLERFSIEVTADHYLHVYRVLANL